jgi:hypothetical protein
VKADVLNAIAACASAAISIGALIVALFALKASNRMGGIDAVRLHAELRPTLTLSVLPYRIKETRYVRVTLTAPDAVTLPFAATLTATIVDRGGCDLYSAEKQKPDAVVPVTRWRPEVGEPGAAAPEPAWELSNLHVGEDRVLRVDRFPRGTEDCTLEVVAQVQLKDFEPWRIRLSTPIEVSTE